MSTPARSIEPWPSGACNRTMDRDDLERPAARRVAAELNALIADLRSRELQVSSWYGSFGLPRDPQSMERINRGYGYRPLPGAVDDRLFPWFLYWEIAWLTIHNDYRPGQRLLDLGGCSSLFSFYMASKGLDVVSLDLNEDLVANADEVAAATGWRLRNIQMDIRELELSERFDHVSSVCVFEHLPVSTRIEMSSRVRELLVPGGSFGLTFDYLNPSRLARINSPEDIEEQFVRPSSLTIRGNRRFIDNGRRYLLHPAHHSLAAQTGWRDQSVALGQFDAGEADQVSGTNEYTFGALFLERP